MSHTAKASEIIAASRRKSLFKRVWLNPGAIPVIVIVSAGCLAIATIAFHHFRNNNFVVVDKNNARPFFREESTHVMNASQLRKYSPWNNWIERGSGHESQAKAPFSE